VARSLVRARELLQWTGRVSLSFYFTVIVIEQKVKVAIVIVYYSEIHFHARQFFTDPKQNETGKAA
jgi:hypothetical protein